MNKLKFLSCCLLSMLIISCSDGQKSAPAAPKPTTSTGSSAKAILDVEEPGEDKSTQTAAPEQPKELALAKKSGCLACHTIQSKLVGPAWVDVAKRYAADKGAREKLIQKVKLGGKGNWTEVTGGAPMPPYFPRATTKDIEDLVDFILSLSKNP